MVFHVTFNVIKECFLRVTHFGLHLVKLYSDEDSGASAAVVLK